MKFLIIFKLSKGAKKKKKTKKKTKKKQKKSETLDWGLLLEQSRERNSNSHY